MAKNTGLPVRRQQRPFRDRGIPLYRWHVLEQDDFTWRRQRIAKE